MCVCDCLSPHVCVMCDAVMSRLLLVWPLVLIWHKPTICSKFVYLVGLPHSHSDGTFCMHGNAQNHKPIGFAYQHAADRCRCAHDLQCLFVPILRNFRLPIRRMHICLCGCVRLSSQRLINVNFFMCVVRRELIIGSCGPDQLIAFAYLDSILISAGQIFINFEIENIPVGQTFLCLAKSRMSAENKLTSADAAIEAHTSHRSP